MWASWESRWRSCCFHLFDAPPLGDVACRGQYAADLPAIVAVQVGVVEHGRDASVAAFEIQRSCAPVRAERVQIAARAVSGSLK